MICSLAGPQLAPLNASLTSNHPECITMSWDPPRYPNGQIQYYEVKFKPFYWPIIYVHVASVVLTPHSDIMISKS